MRVDSIEYRNFVFVDIQKYLYKPSIVQNGYTPFVLFSASSDVHRTIHTLRILFEFAVYNFIFIYIHSGYNI